jgi:hypothetical protein
MKKTLGPFTFESDFDSGNMLNVEQCSNEDAIEQDITDLSKAAFARSADTPNLTQYSTETYKFDVFTKPDGMESNNVTKNRSWFHFSLDYKPTEDEVKGCNIVTVQLRIRNINRVMKLFGMGFKPVFRHESDPNWKRIFSIPKINVTDSGLDLHFSFIFVIDNSFKHESLGSLRYPALPGKYYFAYCTPYSYTDLQSKIVKISKALQSPMRNAKKSRIPLPKSLTSNIYFHHDVLTISRMGRNLDLLTISSLDNITNEVESHIEGLFPIPGTMRSRKFQYGEGKKMRNSDFKKSVVFISARVHPGETVSSFAMDGLVDFLLSNDPRAQLLRSMFVFKIVPMLNPDGVALGNYRGDDLGENLNRVYNDPSQTLHPTIWAVKRYIEIVDNLTWYFDLHGHANKPGTFILANWVDDIEKQCEIMLFTQYLYHNLDSFDLKECLFESTVSSGMFMLRRGQTITII